MREIEEERLTAMLPDEALRFFRVAFGQRLLLDGTLDDLAVAEQRHRPVLGARIARQVAAGSNTFGEAHVVRVGQAEVLVEALAVGQERGQVAEVPLADDHRLVAACFEQLRDRDFFRGQAECGVHVEDARG